MLSQQLDETREAVIETHRDEIDDLEREYADIRQAFEARMASHSRRLEDLWTRIEGELLEASPDLETTRSLRRTRLTKWTGCMTAIAATVGERCSSAPTDGTGRLSGKLRYSP